MLLNFAYSVGTEFPQSTLLGRRSRDGAVLQTGRLQARFPMVPLGFFIDIILSAAL